MKKCPCGSDKSLDMCCMPLINGDQLAPTAEALMRSRYTAFTLAEVDYLLTTIHPRQRKDYKKREILKWAQSSKWLGLEILKTVKGDQNDQIGQVEFVAHYREKEVRKRHHEIAEFEKVDEKWRFVDGKVPKIKSVVRSSKKTGRNELCPCKSGKKFKKCCG